MIACCGVVLDVLLPVLARLVLVVHQVRRPRALDNVLCASALDDDLVTESARLGEDFEVILKVLSNAWEINKGSNTVRLKLILGADTRSVEDVGRTVSSSTDDNLLGSLELDESTVGLNSSNASGLKLALGVLLDKYLFNVSLNHEVEVISGLLLGDKVGTCGAETLVDCPH
ncbi:hypothetical protein HG531_005470 [Fusarium graminearum]|nr:hypothetical protein HG531_005470 [Fusarium graminearum]